MRLPRSKREFALFIAIISIISVNILAPLITCLEQREFSTAVWLDVLKVLPFIWLSVVALELITYKPAEWLTHKIAARGDSFRSVITVNILVTVLMLSIILSVVGTWIGTRAFGADSALRFELILSPLRNYIYIWPRNFAVSLGVELLIAQPIARFVLLKVHQRRDRNTADSTVDSTVESTVEG
jgi:hypothetical protein